MECEKPGYSDYFVHNCNSILVSDFDSVTFNKSVICVPIQLFQQLRMNSVSFLAFWTLVDGFVLSVRSPVT